MCRTPELLRCTCMLSAARSHFNERQLLDGRQPCALRNRVPVSLLRESAGAFELLPSIPNQPQPNRDQVFERMVEFVVKGQQFRGRWANLLPRIAVVCVTVLNAMNVVFMAVFSYFASKGSLQLCLHSPHFNISPRLFVLVQVGHNACES